MAEADFGDRLKRLIIKKNTKVDAVSLESGVPKRTIDNWTSPSRKGNLLPHIVAVYDQGEARAVDSFLKKYRESK